jgi:hypothetical protein
MELSSDPHYHAIQAFYHDRRAQRSAFCTCSFQASGVVDLPVYTVIYSIRRWRGGNCSWGIVCRILCGAKWLPHIFQPHRVCCHR